MEREREENNGTGVRELFAPVFLAKVLREQVVEDGRMDTFRNMPQVPPPKWPKLDSVNQVLNYLTGQGDYFTGLNGNGHLPGIDVVPYESTFFLNDKVKVNVEKVLRFGQILNSTAVLNRDKFCHHFCEQVRSPPMELIWLMDAKYDLLNVSSYLITLTQKEYFFASDFSHRFLTFCFSPSILEFNARGNAIEILEKFFQALIIADECNHEKTSTLAKIRNYSQDILHKITARLIDDSPTLDQSGHHFILRSVSYLPITVSLKQRYFARQLQHIISQKSSLTVEQVIQKQESLSKLSENQLKVDTINMFIGVPQSPIKVVQAIMEKIRKAELINWENTLLTVTLWEKLYNDDVEALRFLKDNIKKLMVEGLNENRPDKVSASFILARHCSLIAPNTFFRYEKWYNSIFAKEQASPIRELHIFSFFTDFLTHWIPIEPPCFLQVQATYWPYIPQAAGCRTVWSEYVSAAKARIQEYNELEGLMELELNANNPLQRDVDAAVRSFTSNGKVPQFILEMILFRKKYYVEQFLPALLRRPLGTPSSDARLRLIEVLNAEGRIPPELYFKYKTGN
ncbi:unnamed protein product [Allacma fusca]|uniref:Uncharacterized protein n=1 Tax=Allacma fusca TaxID=39272 RepID=A0A8J2NQY0_9HEXA|nr:unnamed protein product [Allacma fusca]